MTCNTASKKPCKYRAKQKRETGFEPDVHRIREALIYKVSRIYVVFGVSYVVPSCCII